MSFHVEYHRLPRLSLNVKYRALNLAERRTALGQEQTSASRRHERQVSGVQSGAADVGSGSFCDLRRAAKRS